MTSENTLASNDYYHLMDLNYLSFCVEKARRDNHMMDYWLDSLMNHIKFMETIVKQKNTIK